MKINDTVIQTLGDDDYVCRVCTENLLTLASEKNVTINDSQDNLSHEHESTNNNQSEEPHSPLKDLPQPESKDSQSNDDKENSIKSKSKKVTKSNKMKKEDVVDKSYILELESQIKMLKSTIELQSKTQKTVQTNKSLDQNVTHMKEETDIHSGACSHSCCNALKEKLHENRLRLLETQMMQNMYIQNAMHIQLVSQLKTHCQVPECHNLPHLTSAYQHYTGLHPYPPVVYQPRFVPTHQTPPTVHMAPMYIPQRQVPGNFGNLQPTPVTGVWYTQ